MHMWLSALRATVLGKRKAGDTESMPARNVSRRPARRMLLRSSRPDRLLKHSLASPSAATDVMTQKYVDGIPLARQEKIWKRDGIELSRATMANWVIQCAQSWFEPIYRQLRKALLDQSVIHADETVVQVLKEEGKSASSESRMWQETDPVRKLLEK